MIDYTVTPDNDTLNEWGPITPHSHKGATGERAETKLLKMFQSSFYGSFRGKFAFEIYHFMVDFTHGWRSYAQSFYYRDSDHGKVNRSTDFQCEFDFEIVIRVFEQNRSVVASSAAAATQVLFRVPIKFSKKICLVPTELANAAEIDLRRRRDSWPDW